MNIINHNYKGSSISQRSKDNYVNLNQMCATNGKLVADYLRLDSTQEYLTALSLNMGIPIKSQGKVLGLVQSKKGGNQEPGTWAHPEVAIDCAQWVSVDLRIWANRTLVQVITQNAQLTSGIPAAGIEALPCPEISLRSRIVRAVDNYVLLFRATHSQVWSALYRELKYIYHYDASARLRASGIKRSKLEQVEADNMLEALQSVAQKVLGSEI